MLSISCQLLAKLYIMVCIAYFTFGSPTVISPTSALLLLVLPILIGWISNLLLHARLNTDLHKLSTKEKLIHLLSTTWFTLPVRRMEDRDQRHKGREAVFALLLAGINSLGTSVAHLAITNSISGSAGFLVYYCLLIVLDLLSQFSSINLHYELLTV